MNDMKTSKCGNRECEKCIFSSNYLQNTELNACINFIRWYWQYGMGSRRHSIWTTSSCTWFFDFFYMLFYKPATERSVTSYTNFIQFLPILVPYWWARSVHFTIESAKSVSLTRNGLAQCSDINCTANLTFLLRWRFSANKKMCGSKKRIKKIWHENIFSSAISPTSLHQFSVWSHTK